MKFSYYPGCTLKTKAKDLDAYARKSAEALGFTLEELPEWQCRRARADERARARGGTGDAVFRLS